MSDPGPAGLCPVEITDPDDPRVVGYTRLTDPQLRASFEATHGLFVAEGVTLIRRLLGSGHRVLSVLVTRTKLADLGPELAGRDLPVYVGDRAVLDALTGFPFHRGALALGARPAPVTLETVAAGAHRLVVLEDVNDHENLGAIARSAAALGSDGLVLNPRCCDPLSRRALRVSMGATLELPCVRATDWPAALGVLRGLGFTVLALTPRPGAEPLEAVRPAASDRVALLLGAEGPGLTEAALAAADRLVRIPVSSRVDSLNVAAAAAIACHHVRR